VCGPEVCSGHIGNRSFRPLLPMSGAAQSHELRSCCGELKFFDYRQVKAVCARSSRRSPL